MNEILSGKLTEKDIDNYLNNMDDDATDNKKEKNGTLNYTYIYIIKILIYKFIDLYN